MTGDEQRIAIVNLMGFNGCRDADCAYRKAQHLHKDGQCWFPESFSTRMYPDPPIDLNAIHEAEKLIYDKSNNGIEVMQHIGWVNSIAKEHKTFTHRLTAAQRAEALLRTLGLWEELKSQENI